MADTVQWGEVLQKKLDEQLVQGATSGWMEANAGQVVYSGGKEVKIPQIALDGLGDYSRNASGYPVGEIDLSYQSFIMRMDRAREFNFDRHDVDETNYILNASQVLAQFQKTRVIPEIDAYRYSTIAKAAIAAGYSCSYVPSANSLLGRLNDDITAVQDRTGADNLVITLNRLVYGMLANSGELSKVLDVAGFKQGRANLRLRSLNGYPIIPVSSARMKTDYVFLDGKSAGQEAGGFEAAEGAGVINWIVCPQNAPLAVSKQEKPKIFSPDQNQDKDAWKTQYRKYHDCWVPENTVPAFQVSVRSAG